MNALPLTGYKLAKIITHLLRIGTLLSEAMLKEGHARKSAAKRELILPV